VLQRLGIPHLLRGMSQAATGVQDFQAALLAELLFPERRVSSQAMARLRQLIRSNGYTISDPQLNEIFTSTVPSDLCWFLLKTEAKQAGISVSNINSRQFLEAIIPQLAQIVPELQGQSYTSIVNSIVNPPPRVNRRGIPERRILSTFGELLAVLNYAVATCSDEPVTISQIKHLLSRDGETINVELARIDSAVFAENQPDPEPDEIEAQFEKYKQFFPGQPTDENPYGFGYKIPDRLVLEYMVVKLDEVAGKIPPPSPEQTESYYEQNRARFAEQVPSDPNDPNSPSVTRIRTYAEVAGAIENILRAQKISGEAKRILQRARELTEADITKTGKDISELTVEQLRDSVGDYTAVAEQLSQENAVKVYAGRTGWLTAERVRTDPYLSQAFVQGYGVSPEGYPHIVRLPRIVFAVKELAASTLGPFDVPVPKMYENIGPLADPAGRIMLLVRVVDVAKAAVPESVDQSFSTQSLALDDTQDGSDEIFSVREKVVEDLRKLAAMEQTRNKAEELIKIAAQDGWPAAIDKFNSLYVFANADDPNNPDVDTASGPDTRPVRLQDMNDIRRLSSETIEVISAQSQGDPIGQLFVAGAIKNRMLLDQLYSLVPPDANTPETLPVVLEFKPDLCCYCIKKLSVRRINTRQYAAVKAMRAAAQDFARSQSLAAVHFNPQYILKRMKFRPPDQQTDKNTTAKGKGTS